LMLIMAAGCARLAAHTTALEGSGLPYERGPCAFQLQGIRGTPRSW
jgi:hypothetical protein